MNFSISKDKIKKIIFNKLDNLIEGGLYLKKDNYNSFVLFIRKTDNRIVFRYSIHDLNFKYDNSIFQILYSMFSENLWDVIPDAYSFVGEIVKEYANKNLVPKFNDKIEELTDYEFYIENVFNDVYFNSNTGEFEGDPL